MGAPDVLHLLELSGLRVSLRGESLAITPAEKITPDIRRLIQENKPAILAALENDTTSFRWLVRFTDREALEVYCNPEASHAAILERYPDALAAEPLPERTRREPTDAEAKELRALVRAVGEREGWAAAEVEEATAVALADPDGALTCYRDIAADLGVILWTDDDRRTCDQCANLAGRRCLAAWRGEIAANRDYAPVRDIPRRCEGYIPDATDPDRRSGGERWPGLIEKGV